METVGLETNRPQLKMEPVRGADLIVANTGVPPTPLQLSDAALPPPLPPQTLDYQRPEPPPAPLTLTATRQTVPPSSPILTTLEHEQLPVPTLSPLVPPEHDRSQSPPALSVQTPPTGSTVEPLLTSTVTAPLRLSEIATAPAAADPLTLPSTPTLPPQQTLEAPDTLTTAPTLRLEGTTPPEQEPVPRLPTATVTQPPAATSLSARVSMKLPRGWSPRGVGGMVAGRPTPRPVITVSQL